MDFPKLGFVIYGTVCFGLLATKVPFVWDGKWCLYAYLQIVSSEAILFLCSLRSLDLGSTDDFYGGHNSFVYGLHTMEEY